MILGNTEIPKIIVDQFHLTLLRLLNTYLQLSPKDNSHIHTVHLDIIKVLFIQLMHL